MESCRKKRRVEAGENRRDTKLVSLENRAERAELKYRIALSSAEKKFAILETVCTKIFTHRPLFGASLFSSKRLTNPILILFSVYFVVLRLFL